MEVLLLIILSPILRFYKFFTKNPTTRNRSRWQYLFVLKTVVNRDTVLDEESLSCRISHWELFCKIDELQILRKLSEKMSVKDFIFS